MKLNLLIRTYIINNLYTSLYDIPNKIPFNKVHIYVHNDNPKLKQECENIIQEFRQKYANYKVTIIQENINQQMFMSCINSIPHLDKTNEYTMVLDDDDSLCLFTNDVFAFLEEYKDKNVCIEYKQNKCYKFLLTASPYIIETWREYHRIYSTEALFSFYEYKDVIINLLLKYNGSTKFTTYEDKLMLDLIKIFVQIEDIKLNKVLLNYNVYPHSYNDYNAIHFSYSNITKNLQIIKKIISDLKNNI